MLTAHLRPTFFAEWISWWWGRQGDEGVLRLPFGTGRHAPVAGVDLAYVIAAILERPEPHDRQAYPLHGPVEMDHYGIAKAVSRALGIPVTYEPISVEEFADGLASLGKSSHLIQHLSNVAIEYQNGVFQGTNNLIEAIGNRSPMMVEEFVIDRRHVFDRNGPQFVPRNRHRTVHGDVSQHHDPLLKITLTTTPSDRSSAKQATGTRLGRCDPQADYRRPHGNVVALCPSLHCDPTADT